jgi:phytoene desaturase
MSMPARTDKAAAFSKGQDTLYVLVPVGHLDALSRIRKPLVSRFRKRFSRPAKRNGRGGSQGTYQVRDRVRAFKPGRRFNLEKGLAFGLSHNFGRWAICVHRIVTNNTRIFTCRASTHPGTGLPIVLLSARLTTERILKETDTISV